MSSTAARESILLTRYSKHWRTSSPVRQVQQLNPPLLQIILNLLIPLIFLYSLLIKNRENIALMDIHEILKYLPHRYPLLLVDRVLAFEPGKNLTALKNVTINEPFFTGHFPHHPVMPGCW